MPANQPGTVFALAAGPGGWRHQRAEKPIWRSRPSTTRPGFSSRSRSPLGESTHATIRHPRRSSSSSTRTT